MKKTMKKIVATILTAAMAMTVGMPAFAKNEIEDIAMLDCKTINFSETNNGYEEITLVGENTYYYRQVDLGKTCVIAENENIRETVLYNENNPDMLFIKRENIVSNEKALKKDYVKQNESFDYYRELLTKNQESGYESVNISSSMLEPYSVDPAIEASVRSALTRIGENAYGYGFRSIYTETINSTKVDLQEKMTYDMSKDVVKSFGIGDTLTMVLAVFTNSSANTILGAAQWILTADGIYKLATATNCHDYGVFQRTTREARINAKCYYDTMRTRKWSAFIGESNGVYTAGLDDVYTHYTSNLFNDPHGMCVRAESYYN